MRKITKSRSTRHAVLLECPKASTTKNSGGCQLSTHVNLVNTPLPSHNNVAIGQCLSVWDDDLLVSAAKAGDRNAFVELYERHSRKVLRRIYCITKNREDAEDAFQDAFLRAFAHMKDFEGRSNFTTWLTRIAITSALLVLRKRRGGGAEISIEQIRDDSDNHRAWEPSDHSETPEACCARRESEELLRNAIQSLPSILREAVELRNVGEYTASQIAEELGISVAAAKTRLMRARLTVRRCLYPASATDAALRPNQPSGTIS